MGPGSSSRHNVSTTVLLLEPNMLRHTRVIESNIGIICAFFPFLPGFYQHYRLKHSQVVAIKTITNGIIPFRLSPKRREGGGIDRSETVIQNLPKEKANFWSPAT